MKILHVVDYLMPNMGYQEFILPKFNAIENEVTILTGNAFYPIPNYNNTWKKFLGNRIFEPKNEIIENVEIKRSKIIFEIARRPWISNLEKNIKICKPDIIMVHGTTSFSTIRSFMLSKKLKIPIVFDNHMVLSVVRKDKLGELFYFFLRKIVKNYFSKYVSIVFGVTEETCEYLIKYEGYPKEKVKLLSLGVDTKIFYPKKNIKNEEFRIIQTGKLNFDKRPDILAKAVIKLLKKKNKITLTYYGDGDEKIINEIKSIFEKNNFIHKLSFRGFIPYHDLGSVYNDADLCVFPFGTSLSALECAFCGTNVIMTDDKASLEREKDGIGITYKSGDADDLATKIELILNNSDEFKKNLLKSITELKKKYDYNKI